MKETKISAIVALSLMLLVLVTSITLSVATVSYQREMVGLRKSNIELKKTVEGYRGALEGIKNQLSKVGIKVK